MSDIRAALLTAHGYNAALPPRGVAGPPDPWVEANLHLREHVCKLNGVLIDGHETSDLDNDGTCIYCEQTIPHSEWDLP